jgi:hypothetical protein
MLRNLLVSLSVLTVLATESVHTTNEGGQHKCSLISDVIDEENYGLIKEVLKCEIQHN